jgi:uncharacterized protein (DUF362 family)
MQQKSRVYIADAADRALAVTRLIRESDHPPFTQASVAVKANFNSADPFPAATHPRTLEMLIRELRAAGAGSIVLAERSGMGATRTVLERTGVFRMGKELGFDVIVSDELGNEGWLKHTGAGFHWQQGFWLARPFAGADRVVHTCCLKTHRFGGHFTLSLKNAVGAVAKRVPGIPHDFMHELHASPFQREMIAEISTALRCDLALMDATEGFSHGGPDRGTLIRPGVMLASRDRVALDAAGVALLRSYGTTPEVGRGPVFGLAQIARAASLGIGVSSAGDIELVALDAAAGEQAAAVQKALDRDG